jgi:hypothetical protein
MATKKLAKVNYDANDVWAAAVEVFDNQGYIKTTTKNKENNKINKEIVIELLNDKSKISSKSYDKSHPIRNYFKTYMFKAIKGTLSPFDKCMMAVAEQDTIDCSLSLSLVTCAPEVYNKAIKKDIIDNRIKFATGGCLGKIGDRIETKIEVLKTIWSVKWNTYYVTGITHDDKVLFFSYKSNIEPSTYVTIKGTVKTYSDNLTQLNRVKVI